MKLNPVKARLRSGAPSVGTWINLCSPFSAEYCAHVGFDWIVIDTEHSPISTETTIHCFQALGGTGVVPLARVAGNDPVSMKRLLDGGALGIVVPMVNTVDEARRAVAAMKYPPEGIRSKAGGRASLVYGADYAAVANEEVLVVVQIEHIDAVERAEAILGVPGIDACFIGPHDLASSMGVAPGDTEHEAAIHRTLAAARMTGVAPGIHCADAAGVNQRLAEGFQFVALASDARFLAAKAREELAALRFPETDSEVH